MRSFPFGKAAFSILCLALFSGLWLAAHPIPPKTANLDLWVFAKAHYDAYKTAIPAFEAAHPGVKVNLQLVNNDGLAARLQAAFQADLDVPDLCEIEISSAGTFFRGPLNHVGFLDLTDRIHQTGLWDRMVQARFAPYTSHGHIFGLPHDVHPVMLAYRRDLFEQLHIDVNKIETWDDFIAVGRRVTIPNQRYMIEFSDSSRDGLEACLLQRGGGYFDPQGHCILDNAAAVETMRWYVPLVAGKNQIGNSLGGSQILTKAVEDGYLLCLIAPDWRTKSLENLIPSMAGKMALMPFPAVAHGTPRTTTWGGTMMGITKHCANPDLAWQLAMFLYLTKSQLAQRFADTNILPAVRDAWDQPTFRQPRPYWSGQPLGALYSQLAPRVPFQYSSPFIETAKNKLSEAQIACCEYYKAHGDAGFQEFIQARLKQSADEVRRQIARNPY